MLVSVCVLAALVLGTAVTAWEDNGFDSEHEGMTEEAWCEITGCTWNDSMTSDEIGEEGSSPRTDPNAWGCCQEVKLGDGTVRCHCTEPVPGAGMPTSTAFYVGRTAEASPTYDLIAVKGTKISGVWSYSVCGGCQKAYMDRLLVWGIDSAAYGTDYITLVDANVTYGDGSFTTWWGSYWTSVTVAGLAGNDRIIGSRQDDWLFSGDGDDVIYGRAGGDTLWGVDDDDTLYGEEGDDSLYGGNDSDSLNGGSHVSGDYCNCEGGSDPAATNCEGTIYSCDD